MRSYPIDLERAGTFTVVGVTPKRGEGDEQATNQDGMPKWAIQVLNHPIQDGPFEAKPTLEEIGVACLGIPTFTPLAKVVPVGLTARPWSMNGRNGIALSAETVIEAEAA